MSAPPPPPRRRPVWQRISVSRRRLVRLRPEGFERPVASDLQDGDPGRIGPFLFQAAVRGAPTTQGLEGRSEKDCPCLARQARPDELFEARCRDRRVPRQPHYEIPLCASLDSPACVVPADQLIGHCCLLAY